MLRNIAYLTVIVIYVIIGGLMTYLNLLQQNTGYSLAFFSATFFGAALLFSLYEKPHIAQAELEKQLINFSRDRFVSTLTPELYEQVKHDRVDREGFESAD